jgi:aldose 1-epimerase
MSDIQLRADGVKVVVSTRFAAILRCDVIIDGTAWPALRAATSDAKQTATAASAFPLVPFGNRMAGNRFVFEGREYRLAPNTPDDPCRLHGDGWLADWEIAEVTERKIDLRLLISATSASPYAYEAHQVVALDEGGVGVTLSVASQSRERLPFGLGFHPYFPLTASTTLMASAGDYWREGAGFLPVERRPPPEDLDFSRARFLPQRWVNNGFENWSGVAEIRWAERGLGMRIEADPLFDRYVLFRPDSHFDATWRGDWFCFEPMSHSPAAHRLTDGGGLAALAPGETLEGSIHLKFLR